MALCLGPLYAASIPLNSGHIGGHFSSFVPSAKLSIVEAHRDISVIVFLDFLSVPPGSTAQAWVSVELMVFTSNLVSCAWNQSVKKPSLIDSIEKCPQGVSSFVAGRLRVVVTLPFLQALGWEYPLLIESHDVQHIAFEKTCGILGRIE